MTALTLMTAEQFVLLEQAYTEAREAARQARDAADAASAALRAAQCGEKFPTPRNTMWYCTLQHGHDGDHSNVFSRGERVA